MASRIISTLHDCQHPTGGFGGGPRQLAHLACTFAAICTIVIIGTPEAYALIDKTNLCAYLRRMKRPDGSFCVHEGGGEADVRSSYCAIAVAHLTGLLVTEEGEGEWLRRDLSSFISQCQTHEGGIGAVPGAEAHAGYTYCGVAALKLLGELEAIDVPACRRYARQLQCCESGGFRGRTHKLVDVCYSFWAGALLPMLRSCRDCHDLGMNEGVFDSSALQRYILVASQNSSKGGGFHDKPGKSADYYHTCYALSGLALAQRESNHQLACGEGIVLGSADNYLSIDLIPELNLTGEKVNAIHRYVGYRSTIV